MQETSLFTLAATFSVIPNSIIILYVNRKYQNKLGYLINLSVGLLFHGQIISLLIIALKKLVT